ncbi:hypothetical protein, partial [Pseudomonas syringae group genomosp. 3]
KRSGDFDYFDPSKSVAEGRKGDLSRKHIQLTSQNRSVTRSAIDLSRAHTQDRTQSVQSGMRRGSVGTIVNAAALLSRGGYFSGFQSSDSG